MSANNWARCPKCEHEQDNRMEQVRQMYGKVGADEYTRLVEEAKKPVKQRAEDFREDYEIGVFKDEFCIGYTGECQTCGFRIQFSHKMPALEAGS